MHLDFIYEGVDKQIASRTSMLTKNGRGTFQKKASLLHTDMQYLA